MRVNYSSSPGNTLIAIGYLYDDGLRNYPTSVTDSAGNTWELSVTSAVNPPTAQLAIGSDPEYLTIFVAWCINAAPVTYVDVAREDGGSVWWRLTVSEWSGIGSLDDANAVIDTSGSNTTFNQPPVTLSDAGSLVIGVVASYHGSMTPPSGEWQGLDSFAWIAGGFYLPGVAGAWSPQWDDAPTEWVGAIAAFKPVSSAITGTGATSLKKMTESASGSETVTGTGATSLKKMISSDSGKTTVTGSGATSFKKMSTHGTNITVRKSSSLFVFSPL